jgi:hypothetical protein
MDTLDRNAAAPDEEEPVLVGIDDDSVERHANSLSRAILQPHRSERPKDRKGKTQRPLRGCIYNFHGLASPQETM